MRKSSMFLGNVAIDMKQTTVCENLVVWALIM
jgi:hypothetical protein